jgi:hypothetical protein
MFSLEQLKLKLRDVAAGSWRTFCCCCAALTKGTADVHYSLEIV